MSLRVLLNNPPVKKVSEPYYDTPNFGRAGLAYVAGYLRETIDCEVVIVDSKLERLDFEQTLERIENFRPDVIGFTAFTNEIKPAAQMSKLAKSHLPDMVSVIGGVHVTALPKETLIEFPEFDLAVYGEGELTFSELCQALDQGNSITEIDGLVYRDLGQIHVTNPRERAFDLDAIPFPAWDLLPGAATYFIQVSRGCPFACKFCMNPNGKAVRRRSIENIIEELEWVTTIYEPTDISFGDEIFTVDVDHTKALLRAMIRHGIHTRIRWNASTHVRFIDEELLGLMKESNVSFIGFGVETGDEEKLKTIGKGTTIDMIMNTRKMARKYGIPICSFMIMGQPNETVKSIWKTIKLGVKLNAEIPIFGIMVPYPGTEVSRLAAQGEAGYRILSKDWDDYNKQIGGAMEFANLSRASIEMLQLFAYLSVFIRNFRFLELAKFAWQYRTSGLTIVAKILKGVFGRNEKVEPTQERQEIETQSIADAAAVWQKWQVSELIRAKANNPKTSSYLTKVKV